MARFKFPKSIKKSTSTSVSEMKYGTVKFCTNACGCIVCNNGKEIYFTSENLKNGVTQTLSEGQRVVFEITNDGTNEVISEILEISNDTTSEEFENATSLKSQDNVDGEFVIPVVELFDESGMKLLFELLDTLDYKGDQL